MPQHRFLLIKNEVKRSCSSVLEVNNNNNAEQSDLAVLKTPALELVLQRREGGKGGADPHLRMEPGPQKTGNVYQASPRR